MDEDFYPIIYGERRFVLIEMTGYRTDIAEYLYRMYKMAEVLTLLGRIPT